MAEQDELFDQQPVTAEYNEDNITGMSVKTKCPRLMIQVFGK